MIIFHNYENSSVPTSLIKRKKKQQQQLVTPLHVTLLLFCANLKQVTPLPAQNLEEKGPTAKNS